jgi:alpha-galactosidase
MRLFIAFLIAAVLPAADLAPTPPMGWNSWNHFGRKIDDKTVREVADAIVSSGMKAAGYEYVVIDDTWEGARGSDGEIGSNSKFPDMKALSDYVHSKGLKIGIYSSPGPLTCDKYIGTYRHEEQDARTFARWGIDYVKYDWCGAIAVYKPEDMPRVFKKMSDALRATGRPIVFSISQDGENNVWDWAAASGGQLWRTTPDIKDNWARMSWIGFGQDGFEKYAGPGHWNDADMLEVGNGGMTATEYRTHISLWAILASPLIAGHDPRSMTRDTIELLTNREVIAVDQDPLGRQGHRISKHGELEVWARPLQSGAWAVGLFNRSSAEAKVSVRWAELKLSPAQPVRDLWAHRDLGEITEGYSAAVPSHGVVMIKVGK